MTVTTQDKVNSYSNNQNTVVDDREVDARALLSCASRLRAAIDEQGKDMKAYGDAVRHNQRLWTMFQVALCEPENQLPPHLKGILLNLSRYVDKVSFRAVTSFSPELLDSLININRMIATGLQKRQVETQQSVPQHTTMPAASAPVAPMATSVMTSA